MKRILQIFGIFAFLGSVAVGLYYFVFRQTRRPQVELYFDDGSMLALPANSTEAAPFMNVAREVLAANPVLA
jgi:hypothetical protein